MNIKALIENLDILLEDYPLAKDLKLTSHTLIDNGNEFYNPKAKTPEGMGTFMGKIITSGIGTRTEGSSFHKGLDLKYSFGTDVYAFNNGVISLASPCGDFGRLIIIKDSKGYQHLYAHLSQINVKVGQKITKGDLIGKSGGSRVTNGSIIERGWSPHLHYGIWKPNTSSDGTGAIDPRTYDY